MQKPCTNSTTTPGILIPSLLCPPMRTALVAEWYGQLVHFLMTQVGKIYVKGGSLIQNISLCKVAVVRQSIWLIIV